MIGIFDSGLGGLTVVKEFMDRAPTRPVLYFGDTARTPYGSKSPETIQKYAIEDTRFLTGIGADTIVVACNTVSSTAMPVLRKTFPDVTFFEVITPVVQQALRTDSESEYGMTRTIGVVGTRATIASGAYERAIKERNPETKVITQSCPLLVPFIEEGMGGRIELKSILKDYLAPLREVDTLILGCTHYPLIKRVFEEIMGERTRVLDCANAVVSSVMQAVILKAEPEGSRSIQQKRDPSSGFAGLRMTIDSQFFVSDVTPHFQRIASDWLGIDIALQKVVV